MGRGRRRLSCDEEQRSALRHAVHEQPGVADVCPAAAVCRAARRPAAAQSGSELHRGAAQRRRGLPRPLTAEPHPAPPTLSPSSSQHPTRQHCTAPAVIRARSTGTRYPPASSARSSTCSPSISGPPWPGIVHSAAPPVAAGCPRHWTHPLLRPLPPYHLPLDTASFASSVAGASVLSACAKTCRRGREEAGTAGSTAAPTTRCSLPPCSPSPLPLPPLPLLPCPCPRAAPVASS